MKGSSPLLLVLPLLVACGGESPTGSDPDPVAGTYNLVIVGGSALPIMSTSDEPVEVVSSGFIVLRADGTFSFNERGFSNNEDGEGTFQLDGSSLTFTTLAGDSPQSSGVWRATMGKDRIDVADDDNRIYQR